MEKLSNHLNKTIININTAEEIGLLNNILIRDTSITHILSSEGIVIATEDIINMGDYIAVKCGGSHYSGQPCATALGGIAMYSNGIKIGIISDYEFTKNYKIKRILCEETAQSINKIKTYNQKYMIFNKKTSEKQPKSEDIVVLTEESKESVSAATPRPLVSDYSFLVGRVITRDIFAGQKRLFCSGNTITDNIVSEAKTFNKLVELTLYSQKIV